nr:MAG TPA: hypothetical protein [Inoviridae sp.]
MYTWFFLLALFPSLVLTVTHFYGIVKASSE